MGPLGSTPPLSRVPSAWPRAGNALWPKTYGFGYGSKSKNHRVGRVLSFFSRSSELGLPKDPNPRQRVCPPPRSGGRGTLTGESGVGRVQTPTTGHTVHCDTLYTYTYLCQEPVLRIHDILGWIRIRIRGSMPLTNGSGSCYFRHWPSRCQQKN